MISATSSSTLAFRMIDPSNFISAAVSEGGNLSNNSEFIVQGKSLLGLCRRVAAPRAGRCCGSSRNLPSRIDVTLFGRRNQSMSGCHPSGLEAKHFSGNLARAAPAIEKNRFLHPGLECPDPPFVRGYALPDARRVVPRLLEV